MPSAVWYANGSEIKDNVKYSYDKCGNITEVKENGSLVARYAYDTLNRLIREDNRKLDKTCLYDYDSNGNITIRRGTAFTLKSNVEECEFTSFEYGYEGDRLVSYNGELCKYNGLGSPTKYRGKTATWKYGKLLTELDGTSFTYDALGRRTGKGNIQFVYDNDGNLIRQSNGLEFIYDNSGVIGFKYNSIQYFYRKDVQGNIIAILDRTGNIVVRYNYDAGGNHTIEGYKQLGAVNPFRYRGYYYDTETGLYFLQTRYYDPIIGRFISQDSIEYADPESINGLNLYAYCLDNPVMAIDETGTMPNWLKWLLGGLAFVGAVAITALTGGALAPIFAGMAFSILSGAIIQGTISAVNGGSFWQGFLDGAADGALWGGIFALASSTISAINAIHTASKGVTIGKGMDRVRAMANASNTATYKPMKGYKLISKISPKLANKLSIYHNKVWINRMMKLNAKIYNIGLGAELSAGAWYGMELREIARHSYKVFNLFLLG